MLEGSEEKIQWLLQEYMPQLRFITEPHRKCLVLMSGVPGSGKTLTSEKIEKSLLGVRISSDDQRELLQNRWPNLESEEREAVVKEVVRRIFERLQTASNGLVIVDASVDRQYAFYEDLAIKYGYEIMLIRFDIPFDMLRRRIRDNPDKDQRAKDNYLENLDSWWNDWKEFGQDRNFDMTVSSETKLSDIVSAVVAKLTSMRKNS